MKERSIIMTGDSVRTPKLQSNNNSLAAPRGVNLIPIIGLENKYSAGSDGHIYCYSNARVNNRKPKPFRLSEYLSSERYPCITFVINGRRCNKYVHILICEAFHGERPTPTHEVRHLDGTRNNNLPENLRWGTPAENEADKRRHGRVAEGSRQGVAKLNEEAIRILRIAIPQGLWNPIDAAKVFGVHPSTIRTAVNGKSWKHVN